MGVGQLDMEHGLIISASQNRIADESEVNILSVVSIQFKGC